MTTALLIGVPVFTLRKFIEKPNNVELPISFLGVSVGLFLAALWVRFPAMGLYVDGDDLVARSWWSTRRYARSTMQRCRADEYGGLFFLFGWPVSGGQLQSGHIVLEAGGVCHTLGGTVTSLEAARKQAEAINRWLGLSVGAGVGERRSRARRAGATNQGRHDAAKST